MSPFADTASVRGVPCVPLLVFVGPPGVGKSSATRELARLLDDGAVPYACVDRDEFGLDGLLFEDPLLGLNEMLHAHVAAGAQRLVVAWRVESGIDVARLRSALGWAGVTICRLHAEAPVLLSRITACNDSFQRLHLQAMALAIAPRLAEQAEEDILIETGELPARAVARRALREWRALPATAPVPAGSAVAVA